MENTPDPAENEPLPTTQDDLFKILQDLDIPYELYHHQPVFTVAESDKVNADIPGTHCRNLFLVDKKKAMYLIVAANATAIDLKKLQNIIDSARLSFGSAGRLWTCLGIKPGSVCPFTVLNDKDQQVSVILDAHMMEQGMVNYHPLDNAMTIGISPADLLKFFNHTGHKPHIVDLTPAAPDPT